MCTVSYLPAKAGFILTSNRDEHINRGIARYPDLYKMGDTILAYPVDSKAGGTWFICDGQGNAGVLLNGAFERHIPDPPYRKSRGAVLIELFHHSSPVDAVRKYDFNGIENCTIILWQRGLLYEIRWDGNELSIQNRNPNEAHIWSSATLYSTEMVRERHGWFYDWQKLYSNASQDDILQFHNCTQSENNEYGLRISRENQIATSSITSLRIDHQKAKFVHRDLIQQVDSILEYQLIQMPNSLTQNNIASEPVSKN